MPIPGIVASGISGHLTAPSSFYSIATLTPTGTSAVNFTSIPSTYKHLQLRCLILSSTANGTPMMNLNSDTASNYGSHSIYTPAANTTVGADGFGSTGQIGNGTYNSYGTINSTTTGLVIILDIIDYADTSKYKTVKSMVGCNNNTTTNNTMALASSCWRNTSAVTTINVNPTALNLSTGTSFALYGIKG